MSALSSWVLAAMLEYAPDRDHQPLADAIATVAEQYRFVPGDDDHLATAAILVAISFRESSFDNSAIGDHGKSHCAGQIYLPGKARTREGWSGADLRADPVKCMTVTARKVAESMSACRHLPLGDRLAVYARGSCKSPRGRQLSRDRMRLHEQLLKRSGDAS